MEKEREFIAHYREKDKKPQTVAEHLLQVSQKTGKFASIIGLKEVGELIGLLHDLGKYSEEFQNYIGSATGLIDIDEENYVDKIGKKGKIDHSSAGAQVIFEYFFPKGPEGLIIGQFLSLCIASHHSGLIDCIEPDGTNNFSRRLSKSEEKTHKNEAMNNISDDLKQKLNKLLSDETVVNQLVCKLKNLIDKNNDSKETFNFKRGLLIRFLFSCLVDADRLDSAAFEKPVGTMFRNYGDYTSWDILIERLNQKIIEFDAKVNRNKVDRIRKEISDDCYSFADHTNGIYQLTVPTGGGKTLSSLRFALCHARRNKMDRVVYIVPFTTIIDQNAEEARKILEDRDSKGKYLNRVVLEHHSNLTPEEENWTQKLLSEDWDAPVVFTTSVQFLECLFGFGTRSARRMHQLANSVIIFDEIQTIPIRCVHLFNIALRFLVQNCGSTAVLCTATQPLLDLSKIKPEYKTRSLSIMPEQQMMKDVNKLFKNLNRVEVFYKRIAGGWTDIDVKDLVLEELQETGSVLIVVNTKKSAKTLYKTILNENRGKTFHLSTDMCPRHRMIVLKYIKRRLKKEPIICISTQLIEAGVDIDFGSVIRYLAGLDSIAQAAGRCNRENRLCDSEGNLKPGRVFIINPIDENLDKLENISIGKEITERVLNAYKNTPNSFDNNILGPKAMELYYQYYFYERQNKMNYPVGKNSEAGREDNLFNLLSVNSLSVKNYWKNNNDTSPNIPLKQAFMTSAKEFRAFDLPTRSLIVPFGRMGKKIINELCASPDMEKEFKLRKKAQRYSINLFPYIFDKLIKKGAIHEVQKGAGIYILDKQYYSNQFGLSEEPVNEMEFLNI